MGIRMSIPLSGVPHNDTSHVGTALIRVNFADAQVHDTGAPVVYTDLDLSGVVGSRAAMVQLRVWNKHGSLTKEYTFRSNGDAKVYTTLAATAAGATGNASISTDAIAYIWIKTDAVGIIEWLCSTAQDTEVRVVAYIVNG